MKNIHVMNYTELFDEFKIILNMKYMSNILTNESVRKEFYRTYPRETENIIQSNFLKQFFSKNSKYIDKEAYVFFTLKTLQEEISRGVYDDVREKCKVALKGSDYAYFEVNKKAKMPGDEIRLVRASDLTGEFVIRAESENMKRIKRLKEKIDLKTLFSIHSTSEMKEIYGLDEDLTILLTKLGLIETVAELRPLSMEDRIRLMSTEDGTELSGYVDENKEKLEQNNLESFYKRLPVYLERYPEYFDLDKFLLIAAFRANQHLETIKLSLEENKKLAELLLVIQDNIKSKSARVRGISNDDGTMRGKGEYSYRALLDACGRISENGVYLSTGAEDIVKDDLEQDPMSILDAEPDLIKVMKFTSNELNVLSENEGVFKYLVENCIVNHTQINRILSSSRVSENDLCDLVNQELIDEQSIDIYLKNNHVIGEKLYEILDKRNRFSLNDKMDYYMSGRIELAHLEKMNDEDRKEFRKLFSPQRLIELYRESDSESKYLRYVAAYREFVINTLDKNEKEMLGEVIIEATDGDIEHEDLIRFYEQYLISLSTLESWGGPLLVTRLMREAKLRPIDVKEICKNGNYDCVIQIMKDPAIPRKNKLAIFYTTFADDETALSEEQKMLREDAKEEALKAMKLTESKNNGVRQKSDNVRNTTLTKKRNEYVSEPMNRWTLMRLLDEEYSYEMLDSGMMIFKLPNVNGGLIILEKMFRKEKPDYARATKVIHMSIEEFEKIKSDLIMNGDVFATVVESHPAMDGKFESIWHTTAWGERIAEVAGYKVDKRRSKENIEDIEKEISRIKKSRRLR